jgi:hypothetical protein
LRSSTCTEDYGRLVAGRKLTKEDEADEKKVLEAALYLQDVLAAHVEKRYGFEIPEEVDTALQALHELIEYLQSELPSARHGGRIRDGRYRLCAAVCAEVWRRQHDKLEPYSRNLWQACEKYWQACGQPGTSAKGNLDTTHICGSLPASSFATSANVLIPAPVSTRRSAADRLSARSTPRASQTPIASPHNTHGDHRSP